MNAVAARFFHTPTPTRPRFAGAGVFNCQQPLGQLQGLALYLNGTDLPDEVYAESDVNEVWDACERLLADEGEPMSYWEGDTETAIYCYGKNFQEMQRRLQPFLDEYPLCAQCRVVQIA